MKLSLKDTSELKIFNKVSEEEKEKLESFGDVCIKTDGKYIFLNPYDEYERLRVEKLLGVEGYSWFKEDTGLGNWVLYNSNHYHVDKNREQRKILRLNTSEYSGQPLETPINASSLAGMFSWMTIPQNICFSKRFILDDIVDMSLMFTGTKITKNVNWERCLKTDKVTNTRYMFYKAILPADFNLSDLLNTKNVENMEYMFSQTLIDENCIIDLNTKKVKNMNHMFFKTKFIGKAILGDIFTIRKNCNIDNIFDECIVAGKEVKIGTLEELKELIL